MKPGEEKWQSIQYRGDLADISRLYQEYNVEGFLSARDAQQREHGASQRDRMLKDGVLLNEVLSPRIYGIIRRVQEKLGVAGWFEVFCGHDNEVNAFACLDNAKEPPHHLVAITSAALETLDDDEIASLIGHELGHFIYGHNRLLGLINRDEKSPALTVLPYMGECLFLGWRKKSEISADRIGLIASGSFEASARALIKAGFGLSGKNLNLDVDSLLQQIESIKDKPEIMEAQYQSHPLLPLRLKALHLFSLVASKSGAVIANDADAQIDTLFDWSKRYPRKELHEAIMHIVALAGMKITGVEKDVDEEEIRTIIYVLHNWFTDSPEAELVLDVKERKRRWDKALALLKTKGDDDDKTFIVSRLADIALADGKLLDEEAAVILETAESLGMPSRRAYAIIIGAAQSVGFKVDYQMKELTRKIRSQMVETVRRDAGFGPR